MAISVNEVATPEALALVEALRYRIYCEEKGLFQDGADHAHGRLSDPLDDAGHIWLAEEDGEPVGTLRVLWCRDLALDDDIEENFSLRAFAEVVGPDRMIIFGRFMVLPSHRAGMVSALLLDAAGAFALERSIDVGFVDCEPHLVAFYEAMGYRPYRSVYNDPEFGIKVPLVLVASDRAHLERIGSFIRPLIPDSMPDAEPALLALLGPRSGPLSDPDAVTTLALAYDRHMGERGGLLAGLSADEIEQLCAKATPIEFTAGDDLIKPGHASRTVWLVLDGVVEIVAGQQVVAVRGSGEVVGELAMLLDERRSALVRAASDGNAIALSDRTLLHLIEEQPALAARFFFNLAASLGRTILTGRGCE